MKSNYAYRFSKNDIYFFPTKKQTEENRETKKPEHPYDAVLAHSMMHTIILQLYSNRWEGHLEIPQRTKKPFTHW